LFAEFGIGDSDVFDWFASRNRLAEFSILRSLLRREEVQECIPELLISSETVLTSNDCSIPSIAEADGFSINWTRWFHGIAWDWTAFVFDRRKRTFAVLALTDTD
jgi:hypothetical protein